MHPAPAPQQEHEQRWFLNLPAEFETELFPLQLLHHIQRVERKLGRVGTVRNGPRDPSTSTFRSMAARQ